MNTSASRCSEDWKIFDYEIWMFRALRARRLPADLKTQPEWQYLRNALTEALVLHTRIIIDIILSRGRSPDDIHLKQLLPPFRSEHLEKLQAEYGTTSEPNSPCWKFNKLLAHATTARSTSHDYTDAIAKLNPIIERILNEVEQARSEVGGPTP